MKTFLLYLVVSKRREFTQYKKMQKVIKKSLTPLTAITPDYLFKYYNWETTIFKRHQLFDLKFTLKLNNLFS